LSSLSSVAAASAAAADPAFMLTPAAVLFTSMLAPVVRPSASVSTAAKSGSTSMAEAFGCSFDAATPASAFIWTVSLAISTFTSLAATSALETASSSSSSSSSLSDCLLSVFPALSIWLVSVACCGGESKPLSSLSSVAAASAAAADPAFMLTPAAVLFTSMLAPVVRPSASVSTAAKSGSTSMAEAFGCSFDAATPASAFIWTASLATFTFTSLAATADLETASASSSSSSSSSLIDSLLSVFPALSIWLVLVACCDGDSKPFSFLLSAEAAAADAFFMLTSVAVPFISVLAPVTWLSAFVSTATAAASCSTSVAATFGCLFAAAAAASAFVWAASLGDSTFTSLTATADLETASSSSSSSSLSDSLLSVFPALPSWLVLVASRSGNSKPFSFVVCVVFSDTVSDCSFCLLCLNWVKSGSLAK